MPLTSVDHELSQEDTFRMLLITSSNLCLDSNVVESILLGEAAKAYDRSAMLHLDGSTLSTQLPANVQNFDLS